jgi:membrane fusion protein, multidrug efflux system
MEAISNPKDPTLYVINSQNEIEARPVKLGLEMPDKYEVLEGIKEGDLVMVGSRSQASPGQKVQPKIITP